MPIYLDTIYDCFQTIRVDLNSCYREAQNIYCLTLQKEFADPRFIVTERDEMKYEWKRGISKRQM